METTVLNRCKFCGTPHGEGKGPQLFATHHLYDLSNHTESYVAEYEIRCLDCGIRVYGEYAEDLIHMWNTGSLQHETNKEA